jgi:integrase
MSFTNNEAVIEINPATGEEKRVKGLRRRECGTFTIKSGAISKIFTDYEYSADFMVKGERYRTVLCRASEFADKVTFSRETRQWVNPALDHAVEKLADYRKNAGEGTGPTRRIEEQQLATKRKAIMLEATQQRESVAARKNITVAELITKYDTFVQAKLKSYSSVKTHLNRIRADLGHYQLRDLDLERVEEWQSALAFSTKHSRSANKAKPTEKLSPITVNRHLQTFKAMMTKACDWNLISERRLRDFRKVKLTDERQYRRMDFLSKEEAERLITVAEAEIRPVVICAVATGMRKGEILSLKWSQVDLTHRIINLQKTKSGNPRGIPINDRLDATLRGLVRSITDNHVFLNLETGTRWSDLKKSFNRAVVKAKLAHRGIVFHHLRHTAASWMVMAGVPLAAVKEILGHADLQMVLKYAHLSPQHLGMAVEVLDSRQTDDVARAMNSFL